MGMTCNEALSSIRPSGIRQFSRLAAEAPGCISLTLGEPGEDTPAAIRAAVAPELERGRTHYPPNNGYGFLKDAICAYMGTRGLVFHPDQLIVTSGATEALAAIFAAILNPGDEVIIPTPAFLLYDALTRMQRACPVALPTEGTDFQLDADALEAAVTERTKAIVLNSPLNPTGTILDAASLDAVARLASERGFYVICDDVYEQLVYTDRFEGFASRHPELADRTFVVNSFSKPYAMTGWRLGWAAVPEALVPLVSMAHMYMVSSAVSFTQEAAAAALAYDIAPMREVYRRRRDTTVEALEEMGLACVRPEGAFYAFPSIAGLADSDGEEISAERFCIRAIEEAGVALVPGTCFGSAGHVRLSYAASDEALAEGLRRLKAFCATLGRVREA